MVDSNKRKTLFSLAGLTAAPVVSGVFGSSLAHAGNSLNEASNPSITSIVNESLRIDLQLEGEVPIMRVTNKTDQVVILRHIHPGIIRHGNTSYDLNASLKNSAYGIGGNRSRSIPIVSSNNSVSRKPIPSHYGKRPLQVATIVSSVNGSNSTALARTFFV